MDLEKIRKDFPLLQDGLNGKPVVYFDNACSVLRPLSVINAVDEYYRKYPACGGRSMHKLSVIVSEKYNQTRETVARLIKAKRKEEIIFTRNATESINLVARSFKFNSGDIVLTTDKEHNSNLIPWLVLVKEKGVIHKIVPSKEDNTFDVEKFESMMSDKVKLVSVVHTSNLDGVSTPIEEIIKIAHQYGAKVLVDAAQSVPHSEIDVVKLDVDFLVFSGHKMLGPSGTGILYSKYNILEELNPFLVGGSTVEYSTYDSYKLLPPPEKFEAGLQDFAGIIALGEAVKYIEQVGYKNIKEQEYKLNKFITDEIIGLPKLKIIGPNNPALRGGIVSFNIEGVDPHQIALVLDESYNIMIRSGQHCVHSWFANRGVKGSARVSTYFYNTLEEAKIFTDGLKKFMELYS